ncbi:MAG: hypothetical protein DSZ28_07470 [Thiothrix sp.]|nr:MAG: hypothetical protein DSZ28_07470 [Thiothrix sp.]
MHAIERLIFSNFFFFYLFATIKDTVHMEINTHAIGKSFFRVIGRGERYPPDWRIVNSNK